MRVPVSRIYARNFRSLREVDVPLEPLSVLVGPNGSGKSNLLKVLQFIADTARFDLAESVDLAGGFTRLQRQADPVGAIELAIEGEVTRHASASAPLAVRGSRACSPSAKAESATTRRASPTWCPRSAQTSKVMCR